jgi:uncharacterized protein (TIGR02246 family)
MSCLHRRSTRRQLVRAWLACMAVAAGTAWTVAASAAAADVTGRADDEAAIRTAAAAYVAALGQGDAEKLAALWTADGDIVDAAGNVFNGRDAVTLDKAAAAGRPEFRIHETRLRFVAADVAVEDGSVEVTAASGRPLRGRFSATWVKRDGGWKLAALREARGDEPIAAEALAELDWMVGDWLVVDDPAAGAAPGRPVIEVSCRWNDAKTYLTRVMTITHSPDAPPLEITQRIGWDPLSKTIRSWVFGSDGSHGEADWSRDGRSWVAQARAVLPDGSQSTSLNIYTYDGKDRCAWRSLPTHVGAEHVTPVNMTLIRKPQAAGSQPQRTP